MTDEIPDLLAHLDMSCRHGVDLDMDECDECAGRPVPQGTEAHIWQHDRTPATCANCGQTAATLIGRGEVTGVCRGKPVSQGTEDSPDRLAAVRALYIEWTASTNPVLLAAAGRLRQAAGFSLTDQEREQIQRRQR